ncbi:tetratricopeptide repeat protein [Aquifex pyrophilus]
MKKLYLFLFLLLVACSKPQDRNFWKVHYDLGLAAYHEANYSEAIARFNRALKLNPNEPRIWNQLGLTYMAVGEYKKAEESFMKALTLDPSFTEAKMNLGILYAKVKNYNKAIKFLKEAAEDDYFEKRHEAYYHLALIYKRLNRKDLYLKYLKKAVAYNPNFFPAQFELAEAYENQGKYKEALEIYKSLLRNGYGDNYILYKIAELNYKLGNYRKAKAIVRKLLEEEKLNEEQREEVKKLLTKILKEEHKKVLVEKLKKIKRKRKEERKEVLKRESYFAVQVGAFSTKKRAESLVNTLKNKGLKDIKIINVNGIYKVVYGKFRSSEEAFKAREELKKMGIYGFVVEIR